MSTVAVHPSHSSPLRPRDTDPALRTPRTTTAIRTSTNEMRRSLSSGASARAAGNNASRSPSGERAGRGAQQGRSKSPVHAQQTHAPKAPAQSSNPNSSPHVPLIKKEHPSSPESAAHPANPTSLPPSRHRPRKLDLSRGANQSVPPSASTVGARPSTKDSAGLNVIHDMGIACLSPGFQSQDPGIQAQLQKSMDIREHQRRIIESQMHGKSAGPGEKGPGDSVPPNSAFGKPLGSSRRKGPPPGLAIHAPSAQQFAHEPRVIQSAPLGATFTGLPPKHPSSLSRQVLDHQRPPPPGPGAPQYAAHTPSQASNRLPPISDVLDSARGPPSGFHAPHSTYSPAQPGANAPMASPGYPHPPASAGLQPPRSHPASQPQHPSSREGYPPPSRQREFKSAEEAVQTLSGGREDLQPRMVHYGGHQPPTPPSPRHGEQKAPPTSQPQYAPRSGSGRRRTREEYERDLGEADRMDIDPRERDHDWERRRAAAMNDERRYAAWEDEQRGRRAAPHTGPFGHPIHSPETNRRKKERFMALCAEAWDLLHS